MQLTAVPCGILRPADRLAVADSRGGWAANDIGEVREAGFQLPLVRLSEGELGELSPFEKYTRGDVGAELRPVAAKMKSSRSLCSILPRMIRCVTINT